MSELVAAWFVTGVILYLGLGLLFALAFVAFGVGRIDPSARKGTLGFKLLILPGAAALWPLLLRRWLLGRPPPVEKNAHRRIAKARERG